MKQDINSVTLGEIPSSRTYDDIFAPLTVADDERVTTTRLKFDST